MELIRTKRRIVLAKKGHKLLKQKRDVLVMEFFSLLKEIKVIRQRLADTLGNAQTSLARAIAMEGMVTVQRLALGMTDKLDISFTRARMMGVEVSRLENLNPSYQWPGYLGHSVELTNAIVLYRNVFSDFVHLAEKQHALNKLGEEIQRTKRRVNALEFIRMPFLAKAKKQIAFRLEELERENFSRLKQLKKKN